MTEREGGIASQLFTNEHREQKIRCVGPSAAGGRGERERACARAGARASVHERPRRVMGAREHADAAGRRGVGMGHHGG